MILTSSGTTVEWASSFPSSPCEFCPSAPPSGSTQKVEICGVEICGLEICGLLIVEICGLEICGMGTLLITCTFGTRAGFAARRGLQEARDEARPGDDQLELVVAAGDQLLHARHVQQRAFVLRGRVALVLDREGHVHAVDFAADGRCRDLWRRDLCPASPGVEICGVEICGLEICGVEICGLEICGARLENVRSAATKSAGCGFDPR